MKKYFLTGLVTLLPLVVTIWLVQFIVNLLTKPFMGIVTILISWLPTASQNVVRTLSQILILIALVAITFFLGFVARKFFFNQLLRLGDRILNRIPLVNKVYYTSKEIVRSLFGSKEKSFSQVVILPFPNAECYCVGLISKEAPKTCSALEDNDLVSVFIPTTPNPSTGFLVMSHKSHLVYLDMKTEDAIKYVVSCGVIQPPRSKH